MGSDEQPGLFDAPRRLYVCTPSKLSAYEDCPRRYRYAYVDRPAPRKGPPWAHNSLGTSVHAALRTWFSESSDRRSGMDVVAILRTVWLTEGYRDDAQAKQMFQLAAGWLEGYLTRLDPDAECLGVERVVATRTGVLALSGRVDRIDRRGDELVIVDYKTGRAPGPDDARASRALALYAVASQRMFRMPCRRVELHHLPTGAVVSHEHTEDSLARHVDRAERIAQDAVAAESAVIAGGRPDDVFPLSEGPTCSWCDYRRVCPAGIAAQVREPWAAVARRWERPSEHPAAAEHGHEHEHDGA